MAINRTFYLRFSAAFDETRSRPWPGWRRAVGGGAVGGTAPARVLDLGCGNGRFGRFLSDHFAGPVAYEGWDDNRLLLERATAAFADPRRDLAARFREVDLLTGPWPSASATLVAAFGVLHHVPGHEGRRRFLERAWARVEAGGRLAACFWQFAPDGAPRVATAPWSEAGIDPAAVDPGDHLVRWRRDGSGLRYCHHTSPEEVDALVAGLGADAVDRFVSDGPAGDMNHYVVLERRMAGVTPDRPP